MSMGLAYCCGENGLFLQASYENRHRHSERNDQVDSAAADVQQHRLSSSSAEHHDHRRRPPGAHQAPPPQSYQHHQHPRTQRTSVSVYPPTTSQSAVPAAMTRIQPQYRPVKYVAAAAPRQRRSQSSATRQVLQNSFIFVGNAYILTTFSSCTSI